ncbi:MAG TPA: Ada metal-binding domain-containing protein [Parcubacteria group bacterium]|nr:Ada metal-binding domain-containing protein [Parcubacteria group bacterium]
MEKSPIKPYFLAIVIVLVALLSFGVGRLTSTQREGVEINFDQSLLQNTASAANVSSSVTTGKISASVNGTRYYYPHCKSTVSEKNKIFFDSAAQAEEAGYELAVNCKPK